MSPTIRRHIAESRERFTDKQAALTEKRATMVKRHRLARAEMKSRQQRQWASENLTRASRLPRGLRGLWYRITGKYQAIRTQNESEAAATFARHRLERQRLIETQLSQRAGLQSHIRELRKAQASQLSELRKDVGRYMRFAAKHQRSQASQKLSTGLKLGR